jgi:hypothetical protein
MVDMKRTLQLMVVVLAVAGLAIMSFAQQVPGPTGAEDINETADSRFNRTNGTPQTAQAGNVTELIITAEGSTKAWQGYYGNISGTLSLEDADRNVFYNWTVAEPEGEIYASTNQTLQWQNIKCFDYTADGATEPNRSTLEAFYNMDENDVDGIDETYNETLSTQLFVGTVSVTGCPAAYSNRQATNGYQTEYFQNVLLSEPNTYSSVFTAIIENDDPQNDTDITGYDGQEHDFQLLVPEDGHNATAASTVTTYYFWTEIE